LNYLNKTILYQERRFLWLTKKIYEAFVLEVSPSGKYIKLRVTTPTVVLSNPTWQPMTAINILEVIKEI